MNEFGVGLHNRYVMPVVKEDANTPVFGSRGTDWSQLHAGTPTQEPLPQLARPPSTPSYERAYAETCDRRDRTSTYR